MNFPFLVFHPLLVDAHICMCVYMDVFVKNCDAMYVITAVRTDSVFMSLPCSSTMCLCVLNMLNNGLWKLFAIFHFHSVADANWDTRFNRNVAFFSFEILSISVSFCVKYVRESLWEHFQVKWSLETRYNSTLTITHFASSHLQRKFISIDLQRSTTKNKTI